MRALIRRAAFLAPLVAGAVTAIVGTSSGMASASVAAHRGGGRRRRQLVRRGGLYLHAALDGQHVRDGCESADLQARHRRHGREPVLQRHHRQLTGAIHQLPGLYTDLSNCSTNDVPLGTTSSSPLLNDFSSASTAPAFSYVTGNLCDDMHGTTGCTTGLIQSGDTWLSEWIPLITSTPVYQSGDAAIIVVWDEGAALPGRSATTTPPTRAATSRRS
jgi:hypothetical protein